MRDFIEAFPLHIVEAIDIAKNIKLEYQKINNIVISGQGGSAIGGIISKNISQHYSSVPVIINQDYKTPHFINKNTLFISSSYSGNTEETITALEDAEKKGCQIFCICSGGEILNIAKRKKYNYITIPKGGAPRAMLCFSVIQLLYIIHIINKLSLTELEIKLLNVKHDLVNKKQEIIKIATQSANTINNMMPFIYTFPEFEGVALRFKQQLNENSKQHACFNIIPEMNHNEIVPWNTQNTCVVPVFLKGDSYPRNIDRMTINTSQIKQNVANVIEIEASGEYLNQYFYLLHLVDWISLIIAENNNIDPNEIEAIESLKIQLKNI